MEASTTIKLMLEGNSIFVPDYQRAYSWDTEFDDSKPPKQVNTFLSDLEDYNRSSTEPKYYFGHFIFEKKSENKFGVIDGQQRLTTIIICLSALFIRLKAIRQLSESEEKSFEDIINFETVEYDKQLFKDYVIDRSDKDKNGLTVSAKRIVNAFDFFSEKLADKDEAYLVRLLETVQGSSCTTHPVTDESEAIQMFIFQNNRGKKPSNLEIIKAQFLFNVHLYGGEKKEFLIKEIKSRFEAIYKSISSIEHKINEDDVLVYTLRVHFNSLWESNAIEKINKLLSEENSIAFIESFIQSLSTSFKHLTTFFGQDKSEEEIHSLISLGGIAIAIPFIIKAYKFGLQKSQLSQLCSNLESLVIRHRLIGTRADITSRLNDVYQQFKEDNSDIKPIIDRVDSIKKTPDGWWAYWNNQELERALQGGINPTTAKFLLWKYEKHLESQGKSGYFLRGFDDIKNLELEHIAPQTKNRYPEAGYDTYDEEFINQHINCLGNYLLLSKSHNCSVGNKLFAEKRESYNHLEQQREIQEMTKDKQIWTRAHIQKRKEKIIGVIMSKC